MSIGRYVAREVARELDNKSREFYEFVMPAVDMMEEAGELVVVMDMPGFAKKDIDLKVNGNILSVVAKRDLPEPKGTVYQRHRPARIDKKILLPISVREGESVAAATAAGKAAYSDGVLTIRIPVPGSTNIPIS
ncbi:MAG: heat-shock protein Hsp20 [Nitrososphaera sp.]